MAPARGGNEAPFQDEGADPAFLRRQLQAPAGALRERLDLPHHGGKARLAQSLLQGPEPLALVRRAGEDETRRVQALGRQARSIEFAAGRDPEYRTFARLEEPRQDRQAEAGHRTVIPVAAQTFDFVQRPQRQPTPRQAGIERRRPQRQSRARCRGAALPLDPAHLGPQGGEPGRVRARRQRPTPVRSVPIWHS